MKEIIVLLLLTFSKSIAFGQCTSFGNYKLSKPIIEGKFDALTISKPPKSFKILIELKSSTTGENFKTEAETKIETDGCFMSFTYKKSDTDIYHIGILPCKVTDCKNDVRIIDLDYKIFYAEGTLQK